VVQFEIPQGWQLISVCGKLERMKKPHLVVTPSEHGLGLRGRCSACPETEFDVVALARELTEAVLQAAFDVHFKTVHMREDASQAAARIVRQATESD